MRINRRSFVPCVLILVAVSILHAKGPPVIHVSLNNGLLSIQNDLMERRYVVGSGGRRALFRPDGWILKRNGINMLSPDPDHWFEFCIDGEILKSGDIDLQYQGHQTRRLENGGLEIAVKLEGKRDVPLGASPIQIVYRMQMFPNSLFIREKIELSPIGSERFRLTHHNGNVHLIFPRYHFHIDGAGLREVQEIRLADWEGEVLGNIDWRLRPNDRLQLPGGKSGRNLSQNHMYHPKRIIRNFASGDLECVMKGPVVSFLDGEAAGILMAYEHGSPDADTTQNFLTIHCTSRDENLLIAEIRAHRGAHWDGESVESDDSYSTVWVDVGFFEGESFDQGEAAFWSFMVHHQNEQPASRKPTVYYNTWGMQRDTQLETGIRPQEVLTEARILEEIEYAHDLGVDVFVIDDGWQNCFGDWQPNPDQLPWGFERIKAKLDSLDMRMGLWFAAAGIAPNSQVYKNHSEWLVRNEDGTEAVGRWNKPIGCLSSGFKKYFTELCKYWIDQGVTYFKWDGLDKHLCYSPDHDHGDRNVDPEERAYRSGYNFILAVTDVAREITEYSSDVVIVFDATEKLRNIGLAFLSEARYFWINNGATWYDDLSFYRTKSIRSVSLLYNQIIPTVLQTSANYPIQSEMYGAQRYNVNTTLLGGGGFWGDLSEMDIQERSRVGDIVRLYKRVAPSVVSTRPRVTGSVGASPEIYEFIDPQKSEGMVVAFSGSALQMTYRTQPIATDAVTCILRNAFAILDDGSVELPLLFPQPDATCEVFIISEPDFSGRIIRSTCWLKDAVVTGYDTISFVNGAQGVQEIFWAGHAGKPEVKSENMNDITVHIKQSGKDWRIIIEEKRPGIKIIVSSSNG